MDKHRLRLVLSCIAFVLVSCIDKGSVGLQIVWIAGTGDALYDSSVHDGGAGG